MFEIQKRRLYPTEASMLVKAIKKTPHISGYSYRKWRSSDEVLLARDKQGKLLGACLKDDFGKSWTEIAVIFVFPEARGNGMGKKLFEQAVDDLVARGRNILIMSSEAGIQKAIQESDLDTFQTLSQLDERYKNHCYTLTTYYNIRYHLSAYRNWERIRKRWIYKKKIPYLYGLKLVTH